jgi:RadC-like JAB domain
VALQVHILGILHMPKWIRLLLLFYEFGCTFASAYALSSQYFNMEQFFPPVGKHIGFAAPAHVVPDVATLIMLADQLTNCAGETLIIGGFDSYFRLKAVVSAHDNNAKNTQWVSTNPAGLIKCISLAGARYFFLAHNHPSGNTCPSQADIRFTRQIAAFARTQKMQIIDHIIYGAGHWSSFRGAGYL